MCSHFPWKSAENPHVVRLETLGIPAARTPRLLRRGVEKECFDNSLCVLGLLLTNWVTVRQLTASLDRARAWSLKTTLDELVDEGVQVQNVYESQGT